MTSYRFRPKLLPTLATLALLPVLVQLGLWQWHKAQAKQELQRHIAALAAAPPLALAPQSLPEALPSHRRVTLRGQYEPAYQIMLDNQVHGEEAGYLVLTPLRLEGSALRVLVNRGWVPLGRSRAVLPRIEPPQGTVTLGATVWEAPPPRRVLAGAPEAGPVWQSFDPARYRALAPFALLPFAVRLEAGAAGGYRCDWPRADEKIAMHRGYALQWFGMAALLLVFHGYASLQRERTQDE